MYQISPWALSAARRLKLIGLVTAMCEFARKQQPWSGLLVYGLMMTSEPTVRKS